MNDKKQNTPAVLYVSYDGMLEPLGQSQVLSYLERLSSAYSFWLISYEKPEHRSDADRMAVMRSRLRASGIGWVPLVYHKTPSAPATAFDVAVGTTVALFLVRRHRIRIVHARSYVSALIALAVKRAIGARFVFDMRGFWADERVDGGLWPRDGRLYRITKGLEGRFLRAADHVVTLTHASRNELATFPAMQKGAAPVSVITTCADLDRFAPSGEPDRTFTLGYVGSFGTWYLLDETMRFFAALRERRPEARLLVVNRGEHAAIEEAAKRAGIPQDCLEIRSAAHAEVPNLIRRMHAAMTLIAPFYSKIASAPTKLAEYLGCGVPCVGNVGVGDVADILESDRVGVLVRDLDATALARGVDDLLALLADPGLRDRCVAAARKRFSLVDGVEAYRGIYEKLLIDTPQQEAPKRQINPSRNQLR